MYGEYLKCLISFIVAPIEAFLFHLLWHLTGFTAFFVIWHLYWKLLKKLQLQSVREHIIVVQFSENMILVPPSSDGHQLQEVQKFLRI